MDRRTREQAVSSMELIKYEAACHALAEAHSIDEAKDWADKATALAAYARQVNDRQLEIMSAEIRLRAKRRIGELSADLEKAQHAGPGSVLPKCGKYKAEVLKEVGVSTSEAHRCEQLAA